MSELCRNHATRARFQAPFFSINSRIIVVLMQKRKGPANGALGVLSVPLPSGGFHLPETLNERGGNSARIVFGTFRQFRF